MDTQLYTNNEYNEAEAERPYLTQESSGLAAGCVTIAALVFFVICFLTLMPVLIVVAK